MNQPPSLDRLDERLNLFIQETRARATADTLERRERAEVMNGKLSTLQATIGDLVALQHTQNSNVAEAVEHASVQDAARVLSDAAKVISDARITTLEGGSHDSGVRRSVWKQQAAFAVAGGSFVGVVLGVLKLAGVA